MEDPNCSRKYWIVSLSLLAAVLSVSALLMMLYCWYYPFRAFVGGYTADSLEHIMEKTEKTMKE